MNEQQYIEAANHLAKRTLDQPNLVADGQRIHWLFETVTCRLPSDQAKQELETLLTDITTYYKQRPDDAKMLCGSTNAAEAAWTILASTMLNLDEVVSK